MQMSTTAALTKKRKKHEEAEDEPRSSPKRTKKAKKEQRNGKGNSRAVTADGEFKVVRASLVVSIPPIFASEPMLGVEEMLDSMLMRYIPALQGVVLSHANIRFLNSTAVIQGTCPFANCSVAFDATVWSPRVGMTLTGKVNLCSPDHVSLLIHRTFNISIPRHHIPTDHWEFEYGPAENDPEFGVEALQSQADGDDELLEPMNADTLNEDISQSVAKGGRWIHKVTGDKLGGKDGVLEFTVIGLTIANQMLSLVGSLQPDPFSDAHVAQPAVLSGERGNTRAVDQDADAAAPGEDPLDDIEDVSENDAFGALGRLGEETAARKTEEKARQDATAKAEKKKKKSPKSKESGVHEDAGAERKKRKVKKNE